MKINAFDRFLLSVMPTYGVSRLNARRVAAILEKASAGYDAAGKGPRWFRGSGTSQNFEMRKALVHVRNAARELERNNPYVASAINVIVTNTVGAGLIPVAKHPNKRKKQLADELMHEWAYSTECDYTGNHSLFGMQGLGKRTQSLSGEVLARRRIVTKSQSGVRVPLRIQLLEGDYLDHYRDSHGLPNQQLVQGVEFRGGRPSRYWLFDEHPGERAATSTNAQPIGANEIAHMYWVSRPGQVRGVPDGISAYTRLKKLDDFQDARVEQQIWAAALAGFIHSEDGDAKGDMLPDKLEPGILPRLKSGENITFSNPPQTSDHSSFVMPEQRIVASAYGITYEALTGDYSGVNFASGKMGRIQMFSNIHMWRHHMVIPQFCKKIERWFLEAAFLAGYDLRGVNFEWTPPKKEILDAKNELPAIVDEVRAGLNSWQNACRERGVDPVHLAREIKEDLELFDQFGFVLDVDPRRVTKQGQIQSAAGGKAQTPAPAGESEEEDDDAQ